MGTVLKFHEIVLMLVSLIKMILIPGPVKRFFG